VFNLNHYDCQTLQDIVCFFHNQCIGCVPRIDITSFSLKYPERFHAMKGYLCDALAAVMWASSGTAGKALFNKGDRLCKYSN